MGEKLRERYVPYTVSSFFPLALVITITLAQLLWRSFWTRSKRVNCTRDVCQLISITGPAAQMIMTVCNSERESRHLEVEAICLVIDLVAFGWRIARFSCNSRERRVWARCIPFHRSDAYLFFQIRDVHHTSVMCGWESVSFRIHQRGDARPMPRIR